MHHEGKVNSTKNNLPLQLMYFEACLHQKDATRRAKYLKTESGKIDLKIV